MILVMALQQIGTVQYGLTIEIKMGVKILMKIKTTTVMESMIYLMIAIQKILHIIGVPHLFQIMTQMDVKIPKKMMTMILMGY